MNFKRSCLQFCLSSVKKIGKIFNPLKINVSGLSICNLLLVLIIGFFQVAVRSSRPEVFCKKDVFKNFVKFAGTCFCCSLFFQHSQRLDEILRLSIAICSVFTLLNSFFQKYLSLNTNGNHSISKLI